jgi:leucyl aminopeptidase
MVDLATLTGAVITALGHEVTGVFGNDQALVDELRAAGEAADERLWQLPVWDVHRDAMKSKFADLHNISSPSHGASSITAAAFLSWFTEGVPWAHLDIAGSAWGAKDKDHYRGGGASGVGVRLLLEFLRQRAERPAARPAQRPTRRPARRPTRRTARTGRKA